LPSIWVFCSSNPRMAAVMISLDSFVGMLLDLPRFFNSKTDAVIHTIHTTPR
jgi:hypothetical protein